MSRTKKFKMTDLGPIPEDWEVKSISETCCDYAYGVGAEAVAFDGENKYLRITDIDDESHAFVPSPLASPSFFDECHIAKEGDLFVARTGASVGKSYLYKQEDGRLIFAGFLMKAHIKDACPQFVSYTTQTASYKCWVESESARSGQPGLNLQQLKTCQFAVAPLTEQRRIAAALSDADELIAALTELLEKKRNLKQGAMQQLLTGKRRLPGFKGKWVEKSLFEMAELDKRNFNDGDWIEAEFLCDSGVRLIQTGNVGQGVFEGKNEKYISRQSFNSLGCKRVFPNDVLICRLADPAGRACLAPNINDEMLTSVDVTIFRPSKNYDRSFLVYQMNLPAWYDKIAEACGGTTRTRIARSSLGKMRLEMPSSLCEQRAIAEVLTDMDEEIAGIEAELEKAKNVKTGMMQQLLTGKIRLEVA